MIFYHFPILKYLLTIILGKARAVLCFGAICYLPHAINNHVGIFVRRKSGICGSWVFLFIYIINNHFVVCHNCSFIIKCVFKVFLIFTFRCVCRSCALYRLCLLGICYFHVQTSNTFVHLILLFDIFLHLTIILFSII